MTNLATERYGVTVSHAWLNVEDGGRNVKIFYNSQITKSALNVLTHPCRNIVFQYKKTKITINSRCQSS